VKDISAVVVEAESFNSYLSHQVYFFGAGSDKLNQTILSKNAIFVNDFKISSTFMVPIAYRKFKNEDFEDVAYFEPFYLKDFIATTPKNRML
jgi:tRNA threonylcarbamoyladenosine biosynthesis protein TsaB